MDELIIDEKKYVSSKRAAKITGYAKDYVGQLCREGRIEARLVGRSWYVLESSVREHRYGKEIGGSREDLLVKNQEKSEEVASSDSTITYTQESGAYLPELEDKVSVGESPEPQKYPQTSFTGVSDMQTVWKEWFDSRHLNASDSVDAQNLVAETSPEPEFPGPEQSNYEEVKNEEAVPIHRSYAAEEYVPESHYQAPEALDTEYAEQEEEIYTDDIRVRASRSPLPVSNSIIRAALVGAIILVIGFTAIGSGFGDSYLGIYTNEKPSFASTLVGAVYVSNK